MINTNDFNQRVCIILVNYNGWQDTLECVNSLFSINYPDFLLIIVDNSSTDNSAQQLISKLEEKVSLLKTAAKTSFDTYASVKLKCYTQDEVEQKKYLSTPLDTITLILANVNLGFAGGNNLGTTFAMADDSISFFWYLNNDTVVDKNALSALVGYYKKNFNFNTNNIGIVGSKLKYYHNPKTIQAIGGLYNKWSASTKHIGANQIDLGQFDNEDKTSSMDYIVGASMLVSKEFIKQVGLMNPEYFLYFEEIDWVTRGKVQGFRIGYSAQSIIYHKEGQSTGGNNSNGNKSYLADFYNIQNRIKFTKKYYPECLLTVYLYLLGSILNRVKRKQYARIPMIFKIILSSLVSLK